MHLNDNFAECPESCLLYTSGGIGGTNVDDDPLVKAGITRPAAMDLRKDLASEQDRLKEFYSNYLPRKTKKGDS